MKGGDSSADVDGPRSNRVRGGADPPWLSTTMRRSSAATMASGVALRVVDGAVVVLVAGTDVADGGGSVLGVRVVDG